MRSPRASAVTVALSTFVAVVTVSALVSQLAPLDRAGAVLPDGPITIEGPEADADIVDETTPAVEDPATGAAPPSDTNEGSTDGNAIVVAPAPAETVQPEPEPEPTTSGPPANPGNSGNAPGHTGETGSPPSDQSKP
jgi:hypothetical protein